MLTLLMTITATNHSSSSPIKTLNPSPPPAQPRIPRVHYSSPIPTNSQLTTTHTSFSAAFRQTPTRQTTTTARITPHCSPHVTETVNLLLLFKDIGLDEKETQLVLEKNPRLQTACIESLTSRVASLRSVGIVEFALCRLVARRPEILTAKEIGGFLSYILNDLQGELKPEKLERAFGLTDPRLFAGVTVKIGLLLDHGVPQEKLVHVLDNANLVKAFCLKSVEELERTLVYLIRFGGVGLIVRRPALLNYDLNSQLIPRIGFILELSGGDEDATGAVVQKLPAILTYTVDHLQSHAEFLRSFAGLSDPEIFRIVLVYPNVMSVSIDRKLRPRINFLKQCGLNSNDIFRFLSKAPLFISLSFKENLAKKLGFLVKIGYENRTKELAMAMGAVTRTSCENMQKVIGLFLTYGLSSEDILAMSIKHPQVLQYNHESLDKKLEYLIEDIGRDIGELLAFPAFLGYKLDDRIKLRYELKKNITGEGMSLNKLLSVSSDRFSKKNKLIPVKESLQDEKIEGVVL